MLDRRVRLLSWLIRVTGKQFRSGASVASVRAGYRELNTRFGLPRVDGVDTTIVRIPVAGGSIEAHLHRPARSPAANGVLLYFHGGGWVIGDVTSSDRQARYAARRGAMAVLSVGYRKGPEHPIPTAFEDAMAAYGWLLDNAASLRLDRSRIAVGGDSAGGSIAAAIGAYGAESDYPPPAFQLLIYPPLDGARRFPSRHTYRPGDMVVPEMRHWFVEHALRDRDDLLHRYLVLIDAPHPERTPPTYFLAAGYDALVDEGRAYVERLRESGVAVEYDLRESLPHGFVNIAGFVPEARRALDAAIDATALALAKRGASL